MFDFSIDLSDLEELAEAYSRVPDKVEGILDVHAKQALDIKTREIQKTYSRDIPTVQQYGARRKKQRAAAAKKKAVEARKAARLAKKSGEVLAPVERKPRKPRGKRAAFKKAETAIFGEGLKPISKRKRKAPTDPAWERTNAWAEGQVIQREPGMRTIKTEGKAAEPITNYPEGYEGRLAVIPKGPDGVNRRNAAAETTFNKLGNKLEVALEQMLSDLT